MDFLNVNRLGGEQAYETACVIAKWERDQGMTADNMGVACGTGYWDALAGAALCGKNRSVILLADNSNFRTVFRSNSIIRATEFSHENRAAYLRSSAPTAFLLSSSFQRETIALIQGATSDSSGTMRVDAVKRAGTESVSDLLPTTSGRAPRSEPTMGTPLSAPSTATLQKVSSQRDGMSSILLCR